MASSQSQDMNSILLQIKTLEEEKAKVVKQLEDERVIKSEMQQKVDKMSEAKRTEMKQFLDDALMNYMKQIVADEKLREEFQKGMNRLVDDTEETGVWQVMCCASNAHTKSIQEIERLRIENDELKLRGTGDFRDDSSRKRGREETAEGQEDVSNVWMQFEKEIQTNKGGLRAGF
jgi:hypothetical protein